jgi:hypothetical protein
MRSTVHICTPRTSGFDRGGDIASLHQQPATAKTPNDKTILQRQIDANDRQIDRMVYGLYGLTVEEIGIVEKGE